MKIGIDVVGGDSPPKDLLKSLQSLLNSRSDRLHLTFYITPDITLKASDFAPHDVHFVTCSQKIELHEHPVNVLKEKKDSTLHHAITHLKEKKIDALISTGNTGALLALSKLYLNLLPDISRPALLAMLPTRKGPVAVIDVGANVSCKPHQFIEFARMSIAFQRTRGIENPSLGILNIGSEEIKGTQEIRTAHTHLAQTAKEQPKMIPHFIGNVESHDVFEGRVDTLITEGFAGNIFLKTAEATFSFLIDEIKSYDVAHPQLVDKLEGKFGQEAYPGALLIGVDGIVMKCHSYCDAHSLTNAIDETLSLNENKLIQKISSHL